MENKEEQIKLGSTFVFCWHSTPTSIIKSKILDETTETFMLLYADSGYKHRVIKESFFKMITIIEVVEELDVKIKTK